MPSSVGKRGSLAQLRNVINRRDVSGSDEVIGKYRYRLSYKLNLSSYYAYS